LIWGKKSKSGLDELLEMTEMVVVKLQQQACQKA
jgi:hypothetical protein